MPVQGRHATLAVRSRGPGSHLPRRGSRRASDGLLTAWLPVGSLSEVSEQTSIPADPELDPTATYATDSAEIRRLSRLLRATGETTTTYAPATAQPVAPLPTSTPSDVTAADRAARAAQDRWRRTTAAGRAEVMLRYHDLVLDHRYELMDLIQLESGKARKQAFEEG